MRTYIVQMQVPGIEVGPVKIGITCDVGSRVQSLAGAGPYPIHLLAYKEGDVKEEAALHRAYAKVRLLGEWFQLSTQQIEELCMGWSAAPLPEKVPEILPPLRRHFVHREKVASAGN